MPDDAPAAPSPTAPSPAVSMFKNGPIQVEGGVPLSRRRIVESEHGEPLTYETTAHFEPDDRYFLCRCGGSSNKPFCDSTHNRIGFVGDETASGTYAERSSAIGGTTLTISDDRSVCVHAGFCGNQATNVWKMAAAIDADSVLRSQAIAMVERCPSGALTYSLDGRSEPNEPELPVGIAVIDDGPLLVTGGLPVAGSSGEIETRNRVTLCRCGASSNKPLCDGSHKDAGFEDRG